MTAVEWYSNKLVEILGDMCNEFTQEQTLANHYALKQAKEMEKQQIEKMYSEEEMLKFGEIMAWNIIGRPIAESSIKIILKQLFKQFKK